MDVQTLVSPIETAGHQQRGWSNRGSDVTMPICTHRKWENLAPMISSVRVFLRRIPKPVFNFSCTWSVQMFGSQPVERPTVNVCRIISTWP